MTNDSKSPPLWPFLAVDAMFLGLAVFIVRQAGRPMALWEVASLILCAALGAGAFVIPFLRRAASSQSLLQAQKLADASDKIQKLDELAAQIGNATAQWQNVQDTSAKTAQTAAELSQNMATEARAFTQFLEKANDVERVNLRLEVDKLRRAEAEWLQIVIRLLDQVHALYQAAAQSGQSSLIEQIGHFQTACRDVPRRAGLSVLSAQPGEAFDPKRHQLMPDAPAGENAIILDVLAPGYSYQNRLLRRVVVRLKEQSSEAPSS